MIAPRAAQDQKATQDTSSSSSGGNSSRCINVWALVDVWFRQKVSRCIVNEVPLKAVNWCFLSFKTNRDFPFPKHGSSRQSFCISGRHIVVWQEARASRTMRNKSSSLFTDTNKEEDILAGKKKKQKMLETGASKTKRSLPSASPRHRVSCRNTLAGRRLARIHRDARGKGTCTSQS